MFILPLFWYVIIALWISYLPYGVSFLYSFLKYRKAFINKSANIEDVKEFERRGKELWFQITTKSLSSGFPHFFRSIHSIVETCRELNFRSYKIVVVADEDKSVEEKNIKERLEGDDINVILCKEEYKTNAIKKARAMQYAVEHLYKQIEDKRDKWIFHLDEESLICPQTLFSICQFINSGKHVLGEGAILFPPELSKNKFSAVLDSVRSSTCYFCVGTMTSGKAPNHLHGSNLLVRMDVECEVGWANGVSIAEDQLFGVKVYEKYRNLGWHGGIIFESSPATISSFIKQRKRWVVGTLQNFKNLPSTVKNNIRYRFTIWFSGFLSTVISAPLWVLSFTYVGFISSGSKGIPYIPHGILDTPFVTLNELIVDSFQGDVFKYLNLSFIVPLILGLLAGVSFLTWVLCYLIGFYHNNSYTIPQEYALYNDSTKILKCFMILIFSIWIMGLFENYPMFKGLMEYKSGLASWEVTSK